MRRLEETVVQLEEAKRFAQSDSVPHLRLALLLLDNAAEVLMHRAIENELAHADWYQRLVESLGPERHLDQSGRARLEHLKGKLITPKRRRALSKYFDEKVDFLADDRNYIQAPIARVLKHIHQYRNEAYHRDHVRRESVQPAVLIMFDVVCTLLGTLRRGSTTWHGGDSEAWLERYGFEQFHYDANAIQEAIAVKLREGLSLDGGGIQTALVMHLRSRLHELDGTIDFIVENAQPDRTRDQVLKAVQYWSADQQRWPWDYDAQEFVDFQPKYTLKSIADWTQQVAALDVVADKLELFSWFADIEDALEPCEAMVHEMAGQVDSAIQAEIDRIRGK